MIRRDTAENRRQRRPYPTTPREPSLIRRAVSAVSALFAPKQASRPQDVRRSA